LAQALSVPGPRRQVMIRVLVVDDNSGFRQVLAMLLEGHQDMEVVAQAGSLAEARGRLSGVNVALIDRGLPDGEGLELIDEVRGVSPGAKVLVMSLTGEELHPREALEAGADGVLDKIAPPEQIATQIRSVVGGDSHPIPPSA
jgi:DNA-binding NarL/FixJ family response regulator